MPLILYFVQLSAALTTCGLFLAITSSLAITLSGYGYYFTITILNRRRHIKDTDIYLCTLRLGCWSVICGTLTFLIAALIFISTW